MGERSTVMSLNARRLALRQLEHGDLRWRERVPAFPLPGRGEVHGPARAGAKTTHTPAVAGLLRGAPFARKPKVQVRIFRL